VQAHILTINQAELVMDMRVTEIALAEAKARFSELVGRAEAGEEIVIKRHGAPVAKLVPIVPGVSVAERRQRRLAFREWRRQHGPTLGPDVTIRELIDAGRR
jgi:prevent-host-death family protein